MSQAEASETIVSFGGSSPSGDTLTNDICDPYFIGDLSRLKALRSFLIREAALPPDNPGLVSFGELNLLRLREGGRQPTPSEWEEVEQRNQALSNLLTPELRRKYLVGDVPQALTLQLPVIFILVGAVSLVLAIQAVGSEPIWGVALFVVWLICLGALGSIAFIAMNFLSVQTDATFDLSNFKLVALRIVLGALFALIITLPLGYEGFQTFASNIAMEAGRSSESIASEAPLLLLPFVLGFSTSLVMLVLNRLVDAVQSFFGRTADKPK
jgi:hypothetical protein